MSAKRGRLATDLDMALYSTLTILGVVAAATVKNYVESPWEVAVLVFGSVLAVAVAHTWSGLIADQVARHDGEPNHSSHGAKSQAVVAMFVPAIIIWILQIALNFLDVSDEASINWVLVTLAILLAMESGTGAWRGGLSWGRTFAWSGAGLAVGLGLVALKVAIG